LDAGLRVRTAHHLCVTYLVAVRKECCQFSVLANICPDDLRLCWRWLGRSVAVPCDIFEWPYILRLLLHPEYGSGTSLRNASIFLAFHGVTFKQTWSVSLDTKWRTSHSVRLITVKLRFLRVPPRAVVYRKCGAHLRPALWLSVKVVEINEMPAAD